METPDKYKHEYEYENIQPILFAKSKVLLTEKLPKGVLVNATSGGTIDDDSDSSVGQVSEYESDSDSEEDSIKDVDNIIVLPIW